MPAEPVKPVSHDSRSAQAGTYSPLYSSARGTRKASMPSASKLARSADTRSLPNCGVEVTSKDWNMLETRMSETNPVNGIAAMLAKFQSLGRKSDTKHREAACR